MRPVLIRGARLLDPESGLDAPGALLAQAGRIVALGSDAAADGWIDLTAGDGGGGSHANRVDPATITLAPMEVRILGTAPTAP